MRIIHAGDIIMTGLESEIRRFSECLSVFKHGDIQVVGESKPLIYCGLEICRKGFPYGINQEEFKENVRLCHHAMSLGTMQP